MTVQRFNGLPNGYSVSSLRELEDRKKHNEEAHQNYTCIASSRWENDLASEIYFLYSVNDDTGNPIGTLLFGDSEYVLQQRAGFEYSSYAGFKTYDQKPRFFDGKSVVLLECIPRGRRLHSDRDCVEPESQIMREFWENLELDPEFEMWDSNHSNTRVKAQEFIKLRG